MAPADLLWRRRRSANQSGSAERLGVRPCFQLQADRATVEEFHPVALVNCPACGRQISIEADACPQCGHPSRLPAPTAATTKCYACAAPATTRCQSCGALSCAQHLQSIYVSHGQGGAYELRCESCYSSAEAWKVFGWIIAGIALIVMVVILSMMMGR